jgi:opine dehydrogenase
MNITVVGTGNVGCTLSADLIRKGHQVSLVKTSSLNNQNFDFIEKNRSFRVMDKYVGDYKVELGDVYNQEFEAAITGAELIIITVQTNYHEDIIKRISPFLHDGQAILIEPGYLSTCYLLKHCEKDILVIEAESSPIDCRIIEPGKSCILFKNVLNPVGVFPSSKKDIAQRIMNGLGYPFRFTENVIEAALHNPNLIVHTVGALFSIPRIEYTKGEYWMYREVFTPHVWTVCESLDKEKLRILDRLGIHNSLSYVMACQERNFIDDNRNPLESFFDYALNSSPKGPSAPDSRYLTEDVSQGLVLMESLGKVLGIPTPTASSLITLASTALERDFRKEGRTIESLGDDIIRKIIADSE